MINLPVARAGERYILKLNPAEFPRLVENEKFFLDADNAVYPHGLLRLARVLDAQPDAAVAYGMIAGFGDDDRLVSAYPWDPERLVFGNYIDAMAMVRRSVWMVAPSPMTAAG